MALAVVKIKRFHVKISIHSEYFLLLLVFLSVSVSEQAVRTKTLDSIRFPLDSINYNPAPSPNLN